MSDKNTNDLGNKRYGRKEKLRLPFTENINDKDFIVLKRDQTTEELWIRYNDLKEDILGDVVIPEVEPAVSFMIDYSTEVVILATWFVGNYEGRVSTETNTVAHSSTAKWHLSRLDINNINLDLPNNSTSLWDYIINAVEGTTVLIKVYNREDKSQYVYLSALGDTFTKENASLDVPPYYDLEFEASVLKTANLVNDSIQNPTVAIIIGKQEDVVRNRTDNYTSIPKQEYAVTLTAAEYAAMSSGRPSTTLYMIPCDGSAPIIYLEDLTDVDFGIPADGDILAFNSTTSKWENKTKQQLGITVSKTHVSKTENYTANINEFVHCDSSGGTFTITLPTAVGNAGGQVTVLKEDSSATIVTVDGNGDELINGEASFNISAQWTSRVLESDGTNWFKV